MEGPHVEEYNFVWKLLGQMLHPQRKALLTVSTQSLDPGALPPGRGMLHNGIPPPDNSLRILFKHFFPLFLTFLKIRPPPTVFFFFIAPNVRKSPLLAFAENKTTQPKEASCHDIWLCHHPAGLQEPSEEPERSPPLPDTLLPYFPFPFQGKKEKNKNKKTPFAVSLCGKHLQS